MSHLTRALVVLALSLPALAQAADRCGGVKLEGGQVRLGKTVTEAWVKTSEGKDCLADLVKEIDRNRLVRAVTVAALVPDADRVNGKGLASAKAVAAALVDAGLPKNRVFGLAPAPQRNEAMGISLRYVERALEDVVARIASAGGAVFLGPDEAMLKPVEPGMPVLVNELVKTGPNAHATIHLKDGSGIEVKPESTIKMLVLSIPTPADRQVKIEVLSGGIVADVRKATQLGKFEASSRVAVASVRGTQFRFGVGNEGGARLETLEGVVGVTPANDPSAAPVEVTAGHGTSVSADGKIAPPSALPAAPVAVGPLKGALGADARFEWQAVADAAVYRVELARDADFVIDAASREVSATTLSWPEPLAKGKWFWRVTAVDARGFSGAPSKVYAVTVGK
ncbi:MAG: FecR domain-containing protein [Myxococcaceae bacterium]|nr:FecR domain-containing protein [Myxococcaceae bacterium]